MRRLIFAIAAFVLAFGSGPVRAADDILIGAIYPPSIRGDDGIT